MSKSSPKTAPLPTKEELLRYIRESPRPVGRREIARAFGIKGRDRTVLEGMLRELAEEGKFGSSRRRRPKAAGRLPSVSVIEIAEIDIDGELIARPLSWRGEGKPPRILMAPPERGPRTLNIRALGVGDRVLARLSRTPEGSYEARPIRVLEAAPSQVIGVYGEVATGGRLHPTDRRVKKDFIVAKQDSLGARPGELLLAEALPGRSLGLPMARVIERLGPMDAPRSISLLAIHSHGIPTAFTPEALAEAERAEAPGLEGRTDLRDIPLVTIDGPDARDFDDAVWAEPEPSTPGGWHIIVAIADVAHFVRPDDALDREGRERGNSVYFPDRVVPMLPETLSNGLCSLKPGEDRACLALDLRIDSEGVRFGQRFIRGVMRSAARLTYEQVQAAEEGTQSEIPEHLRSEHLRPEYLRPEYLRKDIIGPLFGAYRALAKARAKRGTLEIDLPEPRVILASDGSVAGIEPEPRFESHRVIEEFMIAANVCAAETLQEAGAACMYRVHDQPDPAKAESLRRFLATLDLKLTRTRALKPAHFNQILKKAEGSAHEHLVNLVILRAQAKAAYDPKNIGHFGLGLQRYCHFTSPIRRYADILVHRALIRALRLGEGGLPDGAESAFARIGVDISATERRAEIAERDAGDRYMTAYLAERVGATFGAHISGVTRFGLFVCLDETGAEGLVPARSLGKERFVHDEALHALIGREQTYRLGQRVKVRLAEADRITGGMIFELVGTRGLGRAPELRRTGRPAAKRARKGRRSKRF